MAAVGSLLVRIGADTGGLRRGGRRAETTMQRMGRQARQSATRLARLGTAAAAAGAALTAELTRRGLQAVDSQAKLARQLGATIDELRGLQMAASDAGISSSDLEKNMTALNRRLGQAVQGTGQAARALDELNLDAQTLIDLPMSERMAVIADSLQDVGTAAERSAIAADLMSRQGIQMLNMFEGGGDGIRDIRREVDEFGLSLSEVDAAQVEAANDAMQRIGRAVEAISQRLAVEFAPILQGIADLFSDAQTESDALTGGVAEFVDTSIRGFAFASDAVEGLRRTVKLTALAGVQGFMEMQRGALELAQFVDDQLISRFQNLRRIMRILPGFTGLVADFILPDFEVGRLEDQLDQAQKKVDIGREEIRRILNAPLPSDGILEWADTVREESRRTAEQVVADRERERDRVGEIQGHLSAEEQERREEDLKRERDARESNLDSLREYLQSEREAEVVAHEERMEWLRDAREEELITEEQFREKKEELEKKHQQTLNQIEKLNQDKRAKFEAASMAQRTAIVADEMRNMTNSVAQENKAMFRMNQIAGIANAIINTHQGVTQALANYPPPISFAMAAAQAAAGFAKVNAIKSQSFGGGGGGSGGGSVGSAPSQAGARSTQPGTGAGEQTTRREITLRGEGITEGLIRELIPALNDAVDDGTRIQAG